MSTPDHTHHYPDGTCSFRCPVWQTDELSDAWAVYYNTEDINRMWKQHVLKAKARGNVQPLREYEEHQTRWPNLPPTHQVSTFDGWT